MDNFRDRLSFANKIKQRLHNLVNELQINNLANKIRF